MRKLALDPESLQVMSFATVEAEGDPRGTVHAHDDTLPTEMQCSKFGCPTKTCDTQEDCNSIDPYYCNSVEPYC
ncbi:MAG TPA: hypothetical protein VF746_02420 [Longimicrobium sp.]